MAISNKETIEILDMSDDLPNGESRFELSIDNCTRASLTRQPNGMVKLNWMVVGPIQWSESKVILQGLLELSVIADELSIGPSDGKKKTRLRK